MIDKLRKLNESFSELFAQKQNVVSECDKSLDSNTTKGNDEVKVKTVDDYGSELLMVNDQLINVLRERDKMQKELVAMEGSEDVFAYDKLKSRIAQADNLEKRLRKRLSQLEESKQPKSVSSELKAILEMLEGEHEYVAPFFAGFYNTLYTDPGDVEFYLFNEPHKVPDELLEWVLANYETTKDYYDDVAKTYLSYLDGELRTTISAWGESTFVEVDSPKYYNYETDRVFGKINITQEINQQINKYLQDNKEAFNEWIKNRHSSRDGFISYYSNDSEEWLALEDLDHNELGSVIGFILKNENNDIRDELNFVTAEDCMWYADVDLAKLQEAFKFDFEVTDLSDLEQCRWDEEKQAYVWNGDVEGQQKLQYESKRARLSRKAKMNEISDELANRVAEKRKAQGTKARREFRAVNDEHTARIAQVFNKYTDKEIMNGTVDKEIKAIDNEFEPIEKELLKDVNKMERNQELMSKRAKRHQSAKQNKNESMNESDESDIIKQAIEKYIQQHQDYIEIYADYREELNDDTIKEIFDNPEEAYNIIDDLYFDNGYFGDDEYESLIENELDLDSDFLEENRDLVEEMVRDYISVCADYDHFLNTDIRVDIFPTINNDYAGDSYVFGDNGLEEVGDPIMFFLESQGYTAEDFIKYYNAQTDFDKGSGKMDVDVKSFLGSMVQELDNLYDGGYAEPVILGSINLKEYINANGNSITIPSNAYCGITDTGNGGGSVLGINLEKPITLSKDQYKMYPYHGYKYNVDDIYGLTSQCWRADIKINASQEETPKHESKRARLSKKAKMNEISDETIKKAERTSKLSGQRITRKIAKANINEISDQLAYNTHHKRVGNVLRTAQNAENLGNSIRRSVNRDLPLSQDEVDNYNKARKDEKTALDKAYNCSRLCFQRKAKLGESEMNEISDGLANGVLDARSRNRTRATGKFLGANEVELNLMRDCSKNHEYDNFENVSGSIENSIKKIEKEMNDADRKYQRSAELNNKRYQRHIRNRNKQ